MFLACVLRGCTEELTSAAYACHAHQNWQGPCTGWSCAGRKWQLLKFEKLLNSRIMLLRMHYFAKPSKMPGSGQIQYTFKRDCVMILDKVFIWLSVAKPVRQLCRCFSQWVSFVKNGADAISSLRACINNVLTTLPDGVATIAAFDNAACTHTACVVSKHIHPAHATMSGNQLPISTLKTQTWW